MIFLYFVSRFIIVWLWLWDLVWICLNSSSDVVCLWLNILYYLVCLFSSGVLSRLWVKFVSIGVLWWINVSVFFLYFYNSLFGYFINRLIILRICIICFLFCCVFWWCWWYWYGYCWIGWICCLSCDNCC